MDSDDQSYVEALPLDAIHSPKYPMRSSIPTKGLERLAESIRAVGVISPIQVRPHGGAYEVVAGDRRVAAARLAGLDVIPAVVVSVEDMEATARTVHENLYREEVNVWDEAHFLTLALDRLDLHPAEMAQQINRSEQYVRNRIDLMLFDEPIQEAVKQGKMGLGVAQRLMKIDNDKSRGQYVRYALEHPITDRIADVWVREANAGTSYDEVPKTVETLDERPKGASTASVQCRLCFGSLTPKDAKFFFACPTCLHALDEANAQPVAPPPSSSSDQTAQKLAPPLGGAFLGARFLGGVKMPPPNPWSLWSISRGL